MPARLTLATTLFVALALAGCAPDTASEGEEPVIEAGLTLPAGFRAQRLYTPAETEGSWVALAKDDQGRLIASDQYGVLFRVTPPPIGSPDSAHVERIPLDIGRANGLLWAHGGLYVVVNDRDGDGGYRSGLYHLTDTDGDDNLDQIRLLKHLEGGGEHGPHAIHLAPDGTTLYVLAGNHTDPPENYSSVAPDVWGEDYLFPPLLDPRGHAADRLPPGGWIARTDSSGASWTLYSTGYRNPYDFALIDGEELIVFDADMEWDLGMPWYRPIRVNHGTSGSEFGWRRGSGKFAAHYPDNLPAIVNIGQGSPTGVVAGDGLAFPTRMQQGVYIFDWSYGTMYFIGLEPDGATYRGTKEEFLSGVPLPLTDGVVGDDGAMYFATGGRRLESHLYRVWYEGDESTTPPSPADPPAERLLRHELEAYHGRVDPAAIDAAWPHLSHPDRFVRYAARIAIENQPPATWSERALTEPDPVARMQALLALARVGPTERRGAALDALAEIDIDDLTHEQELDLVRTYALVLIRMGAPSAARREAMLARFSPRFPSGDAAYDRDLAELLAYLDDPTLVEKTLPLLATSGTEGASELLAANVAERSEQYGPIVAQMLENRPPEQAIALAKSLSYVTRGWTPEHRRTYFGWFFDAMQSSGGASYRGFLDEMRRRALERVPDSEREAIADLTGAPPTGMALLANLPRPEGPGRNWNRQEVGRLLGERMEEGSARPDFARGKRMFDAALCSACHRMGVEGGSTGPDLTQIGTRFNTREITQAILSPNEAVSDQYAATLFTLDDGSTLVGRIVSEAGDSLTVNANPYDASDVRRVARADVVSQTESPVSLMPPGLINPLNEDEVVDLMAYLMAGGNPEHELYE